MCNKKVTGEDQGCDHVEPEFMHTCHKCEMMGSKDTGLHTQFKDCRAGETCCNSGQMQKASNSIAADVHSGDPLAHIACRTGSFAREVAIGH
jgi:hypothetical protein